MEILTQISAIWVLKMKVTLVKKARLFSAKIDENL
jgi:hypothetical protein